MPVLLVTDDQKKNDPDKKSGEADPVLAVVKKYDHVELAEGEYAIETDEKTRTVFNKIMPLLRSNIHLIVITLTKPFASSIPGPVGDWLRRHLPEN
jgi:hypothetical protein